MLVLKERTLNIVINFISLSGVVEEIKESGTDGTNIDAKVKFMERKGKHFLMVESAAAYTCTFLNNELLCVFDTAPFPVSQRLWGLPQSCIEKADDLLKHLS